MRILMLGESLDRQGGIVSVEKLILQQAPVDLQINHIPTLPNGSTLRKILVFVQALGRLCWQILQKKVDIVHIHVSERGSAFRQAITTMIAWMFQKTVIIHMHSAEFHIFYAHLPPFIKTVLSWIFCKSNRFIVLSNNWRKYYIDNLGLKAEQIYILPNPVKFPPKVSQRPLTQKVNFLFLGRIGERKGAFDLIQAFAAIPAEQRQNTQLVMAGDGEGERARSLVDNLQLSDCITILNWVDEPQRDALLGKADVFILPSYNEGLPMALLEAMSWELPVITTPVGGIPELVISEENGLLVQPGQVQELLLAMQLLINDYELRQRLGRNARKSVQSFDINQYMTYLSKIYHSALTESN